MLALLRLRRSICCWVSHSGRALPLDRSGRRVAFGEIADDLEEAAQGLVEDLRHGLHGVDPPHDLTGQGDRSLHVAAEVEVDGAAELVHPDVLLALQPGRA